MADQYVEIEIISDGELRENLIGNLSQLGIEGFWEDGSSLRCYVSGTRWIPGMLDEVKAVIGRMTRSSSSVAPRISVRTLDNRNWNEEWEKTIRPIQVTDSIVVTPTWHTHDPSPGQIVLTIDPKMSFGTGYHESTRLALRLLERYVKPGMHVLDIGTGTGVLAIAAIKLGAMHVTAVDSDEWSYRNALENMQRNEVATQVHLIQGEISSVPIQKFDIITANIQLNVLVSLVADMTIYLSRGGNVLLSGLLRPDRDPMIHALNVAGFTIMEELSENEWIALAGSC